MLTALSNDKADEVIDLSSASKYVIVTGLCHTVVGSLPVWYIGALNQVFDSGSQGRINWTLLLANLDGPRLEGVD